jgi:cytidine deaminase
MEIDWAALRSAAIEVMASAYAPYSRFPVGAAALVDDGRVVVGCNVENAAYGVGLCAECGVVSALQATGGGRLVALCVVNGDSEPLMPCGRCRQLLWEHGGADCLVDAEPRPLSMAEVLPYAFGQADLDAIVRPAASTRSERSLGVPAALAEWRGRGTVFVHPDVAGGERVWTGYWERSTGFAAADAPVDQVADAGPERATSVEVEPVGILEEAPTWPTATEAVAWGQARTTRVVVVDADGTTSWAGEGVPPAEVGKRWEDQ